MCCAMCCNNYFNECCEQIQRQQTVFISTVGIHMNKQFNLFCLFPFSHNLHDNFPLSLSHFTFYVHIFSVCEEDEIILPVRYYPESLSALSKATRFSEDEIKRMYRSFKASCPTGFIREDTFKDIYSQFFPFGGKC